METNRKSEHMLWAEYLAAVDYIAKTYGPRLSIYAGDSSKAQKETDDD